jgi:lipopolysaccharide/colanic/teichoic acid biosynthesis glycosyltransferase
MLKRGFDIFLSSIGLVLSSPLWLIISVAIYLDERGSIFFFQERVGKWGRKFQAYKFRSMKMGVKKDLQASENDTRVTRVGRILRATAMDELPQLINILKGDMSFVGPRALLAEETETQQSKKNPGRLDSLFRARCAVSPGLTGVAQIFAPRDVPREKKYRYDLFYIRHQSFWLDLKLIVFSFLITFRGAWEIRDNKLKRLRKRYV